jgi:hypothetical protein
MGNVIQPTMPRTARQAIPARYAKRGLIESYRLAPGEGEAEVEVTGTHEPAPPPHGSAFRPASFLVPAILKKRSSTSCFGSHALVKKNRSAPFGRRFQDAHTCPYLQHQIFYFNICAHKF